MADETTVEKVARAICGIGCSTVHDGRKCNGYFQEARAALAAYESHLKVSGLVIVPAEPTEAMVKAAFTQTEFEWDYDEHRKVYRAMVAVAQEMAR